MNSEVGMRKSELWVVSCGLRVTSCGLRVAGCGLRVSGCGLRVTGLERQRAEIRGQMTEALNFRFGIVDFGLKLRRVETHYIVNGYLN